jgi:hypothetical protein
MKKYVKCKLCERELDKIAIGLSKKLLGKNSKCFYCLDCLADYLDVTVEDLLDKVEEFKEEGCTMFL